jgi:hypothetical protein
MMKRLLLMAAMPVVLLSCYPAGPDYVEDLDVDVHDVQQ